MTVRCTSYGVVVVDGRTVAPEVHAPWPVEELVIRVRVRTPDEWWIWAWEVLEASDEGRTGGPLGPGVDYYCDDHSLAFPPEVRDEIQETVYDEAVTLLEIETRAHLARLHAALSWAKQ